MLYCVRAPFLLFAFFSLFFPVALMFESLPVDILSIFIVVVWLSNVLGFPRLIRTCGDPGLELSLLWIDFGQLLRSNLVGALFNLFLRRRTEPIEDWLLFDLLLLTLAGEAGSSNYSLIFSIFSDKKPGFLSWLFPKFFESLMRKGDLASSMGVIWRVGLLGF